MKLKKASPIYQKDSFSRPRKFNQKTQKPKKVKKKHGKKI
jgi:hypothetical protein